MTDLKAELEDKWKLPEYEDGSEHIVSYNNTVSDSRGWEYTKAGRRRATKELAERCAKASKTRDLLEAYRDHLEPNSKDRSYFIGTYQGIYSPLKFGAGKDDAIGLVRMSRDTAEQIVNALNTNKITL